MTAGVEPPLAGRREWWGLAVLALPTILLALDLSVLFLALPRLSTDLGASAIQQLWITDIYGFLVAGLLVTMGTVGDRIGRRRLLLIGAAAFALASAIAAGSTSAPMLIAARAALGIAGATLMPSTLALLTDMFRHPQQRAMAIAGWMSCFLAGTAAGPLIGGVLLQWFWWGSVFLLGIPVMVLLLVAGPLLLPEHRTRTAGRPDLPSVGLSLAAILLVIWGLKELSRYGWQPAPVLSIVAGVALAAGFVRRQRRLADPVLELRLFEHRAVPPALVVMLVGGAFLGGTTLLVTQFLQLVLGLSPLHAGLWLVPPALAMIAGSLLAPALARRIRPGAVMAAGLAIAATGYLALTQLDGSGGLAVLVLGWSVVMFGNGLPAGLSVDLVVGSVPPQRAGSASGTSETSTELGLALGIAALGSLGTAIYRDRLGEIPSAVSPATASATRDSLAGATAAAGDLPGLLAAAQDAYASGFVVVAGLSTVAFLALAAFTAVTLRRVPAYRDGQRNGEDVPPAPVTGA